jgi:hypothetical protein
MKVNVYPWYFAVKALALLSIAPFVQPDDVQTCLTVGLLSLAAVPIFAIIR